MIPYDLIGDYVSVYRLCIYDADKYDGGFGNLIFFLIERL